MEHNVQSALEAAVKWYTEVEIKLRVLYLSLSSINYNVSDTSLLK